MQVVCTNNRLVSELCQIGWIEWNVETGQVFHFCGSHGGFMY